MRWHVNSLVSSISGKEGKEVFWPKGISRIWWLLSWQGCLQPGLGISLWGETGKTSHALVRSMVIAGKGVDKVTHRWTRVRNSTTYRICGG